MSDPQPPSEALKLLRSIDVTMKRILQALAPQTPGKEAPKEIASARDLDSQYGDPKINNDPRNWKGPSMKGRTCSEVPLAHVKAGYLEMWAEMQDYFASRDEENDKRTDKGKPLAPYKRKDAARARGWEKRILDGWTPPAADAASSSAWGEPADAPSEGDFSW